MNLGIYGGSFNPIHYGHLNVARQAITDLQLDRLLVIPANVSPFKTNAPVREYVSPLPDRLEMVRAVFADMEKVVVDDRELRRGGVSYAIDTVREIIAEYSRLSPSAGLASYLRLIDGIRGLHGIGRGIGVHLGILPGGEEQGDVVLLAERSNETHPLVMPLSGDSRLIADVSHTLHRLGSRRRIFLTAETGIEDDSLFRVQELGE